MKTIYSKKVSEFLKVSRHKCVRDYINNETSLENKNKIQDCFVKWLRQDTDTSTEVFDAKPYFEELFKQMGKVINPVQGDS